MLVFLFIAFLLRHTQAQLKEKSGSGYTFKFAIINYFLIIVL